MGKKSKPVTPIEAFENYTVIGNGLWKDEPKSEVERQLEEYLKDTFQGKSKGPDRDFKIYTGELGAQMFQMALQDEVSRMGRLQPVRVELDTPAPTAYRGATDLELITYLDQISREDEA